MKQQTYISYLEDENGRMIDFERWAYKKVDTIIKAVKELYKHPIYKSKLQKSKIFAIYETPDGYSRNKIPVYKISINELLS